MNSLRIHAFCYYLTEVGSVTWSAEDFRARNIIKFVKGEAFNGYLELKAGKTRFRFRAEDRDHFLPLVYSALARKLSALLDGEFTIVPIPNSEATAGSADSFQTLEHARKIAEKVGTRAQAIDCLRWKTPKPKAHQGGGRDPDVHFANMCMVSAPATPVVLFDDVLTSGSQMVAAARRLAVSGFKPEFAIVVGRADKEQHMKMVEWSEFDLDLTLPFHDALSALS